MDPYSTLRSFQGVETTPKPCVVFALIRPKKMCLLGKHWLKMTKYGTLPETGPVVLYALPGGSHYLKASGLPKETVVLQSLTQVLTHPSLGNLCKVAKSELLAPPTRNPGMMRQPEQHHTVDGQLGTAKRVRRQSENQTNYRTEIDFTGLNAVPITRELVTRHRSQVFSFHCAYAFPAGADKPKPE